MTCYQAVTWDASGSILDIFRTDYSPAGWMSLCTMLRYHREGINLVVITIVETK